MNPTKDSSQGGERQPYKGFLVGRYTGVGKKPASGMHRQTLLRVGGETLPRAHGNKTFLRFASAQPWPDACVVMTVDSLLGKPGLSRKAVPLNGRRGLQVKAPPLEIKDLVQDHRNIRGHTGPCIIVRVRCIVLRLAQADRRRVLPNSQQ